MANSKEKLFSEFAPAKHLSPTTVGYEFRSLCSPIDYNFSRYAELSEVPVQFL